MLKRFTGPTRVWAALAAVITLLCGGLYLSLQQSLRASGNDPQIQLAEDAAAALSTGSSVRSLVEGERIDMAKSLAPFLIVYDEDGRPVASSVELGGVVPRVPAGVLAYARERGQHRVTWQPRRGVRVAAVIVPFHGQTSGWVLAGRSLREVENRTSRLLVRVAGFWGFSLFATLVLVSVLMH